MKTMKVFERKRKKVERKVYERIGIFELFIQQHLFLMTLIACVKAESFNVKLEC